MPTWFTRSEFATISHFSRTLRQRVPGLLFSLFPFGRSRCERLRTNGGYALVHPVASCQSCPVIQSQKLPIPLTRRCARGRTR